MTTNWLIAPCERLSYLNDWDEEAAGIAAVLYQASLEGRGGCGCSTMHPFQLQARPRVEFPSQPENQTVLGELLNGFRNESRPQHENRNVLGDLLNGFRNEFRDRPTEEPGKCLAAPFNPRNPSRIRKCIDKGRAPCQEIFTCRFAPQLMADTDFL
jgi:hypothetical protein